MRTLQGSSKRAQRSLAGDLKRRAALRWGGVSTSPARLHRARAIQPLLEPLVTIKMEGRPPKHLTDDFTSRDLFGVVRGACTSCNQCGRYTKRTADYTVPASDRVRRRRRLGGGSRPVRVRAERTHFPPLPCPAPSQLQSRRHPDNDPSITHCSRCGCPTEAHEVVEHEQARFSTAPVLACGAAACSPRTAAAAHGVPSTAPPPAPNSFECTGEGAGERRVCAGPPRRGGGALQPRPGIVPH